jgi:putative DNA primase/helicase
MKFEEFAKLHGVIIDRIVMDKNMRVPTIDHPTKLNGTYRFLGNVGFVRNFATMDKSATWFDDTKEYTPAMRMKSKEAYEKKRKEEAEKASKKAGWIMHQTQKDFHPYLASKGFEYEVSNIWVKEDGKLLVIPMKVGSKLIGCQLISDKGEKKFLQGQTSKGATFTMNAKGFPIFCEGYATGLSVREVLKASNIPYCIHICFSATNVEFVAGQFSNGLVIADNDHSHTGEFSAKKTGKPYWISSTVGEDFNDFHKRVGTFQASQSLKTILTQYKLVA